MLKALLLPLILCVVSLQAQGKNTFESQIVGLTLTKPNSWRFITADENAQNMSRVELDDKDLQAAMVKYSAVPLVALVKHPDPFDDLNPSFRINTRPFGDLDPSNPRRVIEIAISQIERAVPDFQLDQAPVDADVDGLKSAYARFRYSLRTADGRSYPTTSEIWIVPRGKYFFMIGAGTRTDEATGSRQEIQEILRSLRIRR